MKTVTLGPWLKGINNSAEGHLLPRTSKERPGDACRDALNVDFMDDGRSVTRNGYETVSVGTSLHSLRRQGDKVLLGMASTINVVESLNPLSLTQLRSGLDVRTISYAERGGEVWWSNGVQSGRISALNADSPWVPPAPGNIVSLADGVGNLHPGAYRIALTHSMADGEESVTSDIYDHTLAATGAIVVTLPAAQAGVTYFNIYCTEANGDILQKYSTVVAATASVTITDPADGRQLRNRGFLSPLPAGDAICFHGNRLLSLKGEFLYYSEPWDYGVYDPQQNFVVLGQTGSLLASVEEGVFVAADRTWFYSGDDIKAAVPVEVQKVGAVSGTVFEHPDDTRAKGWYSQEGLVVGMPDGGLKKVQKELGFIAPTAISGSTWLRERDGQTHVVVSLDATAAYGKDVSADFTRARMRYNDDATTMSINLTTGATSRYAEWHMNSYATIDGDEYGVDSVGMHLLEGGDDAGAAIYATIDCGRVGFESLHQKAPEHVYTAAKASAPIVVTIELPDGSIYDYPARSSDADELRMHRHDSMKGLMNTRQTWFDLVIRNDTGSTFDLSGVQVLVAESQRRI
jgi:hypothetical protein